MDIEFRTKSFTYKIDDDLCVGVRHLDQEQGIMEIEIKTGTFTYRINMADKLNSAELLSVVKDEIIKIMQEKGFNLEVDNFSVENDCWIADLSLVDNKKNSLL